MQSAVTTYLQFLSAMFSPFSNAEVSSRGQAMSKQATNQFAWLVNIIWMYMVALHNIWVAPGSENTKIWNQGQQNEREPQAANRWNTV